jgi:hypothetical protein
MTDRQFAKLIMSIQVIILGIKEKYPQYEKSINRNIESLNYKSNEVVNINNILDHLIKVCTAVEEYELCVEITKMKEKVNNDQK